MSFMAPSNSAPFDYATENYYNAERSPSTIHVKNTMLRKYFFRYLMQKAMSVFKWELPEQWDSDFFKYTLYGCGFIVVLNVPKYGVICQNGALSGYNLYYRPSQTIVTNPLFGSVTKTIDKDCSVIKLTPDYAGVMDKVGYYADMMALCAEGIGMNLVNTKFGTIFGAEDKRQAVTYQKMFDKLSTDPVVVIGKKLFGDDGSPNWYPFTQHIKESYIVSDMLADMKKIEAQFDTDFGIPSANTEKRERLVTDEVNANNVETVTTSELWLETITKGMNAANKMFDLKLSVDWRINPYKGGSENGKSNESVNTESV